jgi:hypothetical protein
VNTKIKNPIVYGAEARLLNMCMTSQGGPMTNEEQKVLEEWMAVRRAQNPRWVFFLVLSLLFAAFVLFMGVIVGSAFQ